MEATKPLVAKINQYLIRLNNEQQQAVLTIAKTFAATQEDWWDEINTEQQQAIDNALAEMKAGKLIPHEEIMAKLANGCRNNYGSILDTLTAPDWIYKNEKTHIKHGP